MSGLITIFRGVITSILMTINTIILGGIVMIIGAIKISSENLKWQIFWTKPLVFFCELWESVCQLIERCFSGVKWNIEIEGDLDRKKSYLLVSNHQSNADVAVLQRVLGKKIPFMRFFVKAELRKLPIFGFCWQAADCPFMNRYSKEEILANPSLRGKDLEQTRESCRKLLCVAIVIACCCFSSHES